MDTRTRIIAIAAILALVTGVWTAFAFDWRQGLVVWLIGDALILAFAALARKDG